MIEILDVTPRDGLQNEAEVLSVDDRVALVERLIAAGVSRMETVSFVNPKRVPQMAHAEEVMAQVPRGPGIVHTGLVLNSRGAERAVAAAVDEANLVIPVTDSFALRNQGRTYAELVEDAALSTRIAREGGLKVTVTLAVAFGCPFEGAIPERRLLDAIRSAMAWDIDEIALADTVGVGVPRQVDWFVDAVRTAGAELGKQRLPLRFHFHNTRNTGYANALRAAELWDGVVLDASVGGFGGCPFAPRATGNIATEDLLWQLDLSDFEHSELEFDRLAATGEWLSGRLGKRSPSLLPRAGWFPDRAASRA